MKSLKEKLIDLAKGSRGETADVVNEWDLLAKASALATIETAALLLEAKARELPLTSEMGLGYIRAAKMVLALRDDLRY